MTSTFKNQFQQDLYQETLELWGKYSNEYCSILEEYYDLIDTKRSMGLKLGQLTKSSLKEFPAIAVLCMPDIDEVKYYLRRISSEKLRRVNRQIKEYIDSKIRADLLAKIHDYKAQIRRAKNPGSPWSMSPDACRNGRKCVQHGRISDEDR